MNITIEEIIKLFNIIITKLKKNKINTKNSLEDYYRDIPFENLYNPYKEPNKLTLWQLNDDVEEIKKIFSWREVSSYDLKLLSNILKNISYNSQWKW